MRNTKRLVVVGLISILALGIAPAQSASAAGTKIAPNAISCCR
jgi:hypothetical protein